MDKLIFKTSGLRGRANLIINPDIALRIGKAFAYWIKNKYNAKDFYVYLGYDNRRNSEIIADTISASLISSGINVIRFNEIVPTPLVIHATVNNESHGGIMITGSHLPATDNGIILFDHTGNYYKGELEEHDVAYVDWQYLGKISYATSEISEYKIFIINQAKKLNIVENSWKVLIDTVHGPMREYLKLAVSQFTENIVYINEEYDDTFPGRNSEPTPVSITPAKIKLIEQECDIGIATDMDGDRVLFITKSGEIISGDYLGAILANIFWKRYPEIPIVAPINTSNVIEIAAKKVDGKIHYCNVGPPSIILAIREQAAKFGFEETGKYIFSDIGIWPDSAISTLFLVSLLQSSGKSLDDFLHDYIKLYSLKEKIAAPQELGAKVVDILVEEWNKDIVTLKQFIEKLKEKYNLRINITSFDEITDLRINSINSMDGLRINLSNNSYLMIRPSGTENYIRVFCEYPDNEKVEILSNLGISIVNKLMNYIINNN